MLLFSLLILPAMGRHVRLAGHSRLNTTTRTDSDLAHVQQVFHLEIEH